MANSRHSPIPGSSALGKLAGALRWLAVEPKLLALIMIVLALVILTLGVVMQGELDSGTFMIALAALVIIFVIAVVLAGAYLLHDLRKSRETKETTDRMIESKDRAYKSRGFTLTDALPSGPPGARPEPREERKGRRPAGAASRKSHGSAR